MTATLPYDIYVQILSHLPPSRRAHDDSSVKALVACLQANSVLRQAASSSIIWEAHYRKRYTHLPIPIPADIHDWKARYFERRRVDNRTLECLDNVVNESTSWETFWNTEGPFTFECWDVLELEVEYNLPEKCLGVIKDPECNGKPRSLTRGYWAQNLLRTIARFHALGVWERLVASPTSVSFTESHNTLSVFFGVSPYTLASQLDALGTKYLNYVKYQGIPIPSTPSPEFLKEKCECVCRFMRDEGFGPAEGGAFTLTMNSFPHAYLTTHKRTIPISLVHIFVFLASRIGITAFPVNFPGRVLAHIPLSNGDGFYVDVFNSHSKAILSNDLSEFQGVQAWDLAGLTAHGLDMLVRAGRNIYHSSQSSREYTVDIQYAVDTASCVALAMTGEPGLVRFLMQEASLVSPLDSYVILPALAKILHPEGTRQMLTSAYQQSQDEYLRGRARKRSRVEHPQVKYFVGMFFVHAKYQYHGCIIGWEPTCTMSQQWKDRNGIDGLSRGAHQPFYSSLSITANSQGVLQTFVAEENIQPIPLTSSDFVLQCIKFQKDFGAYFEGIDPHPSRWRMLLSPQLRQMYPQDDVFGTSWVERMGT
ncbi:Hemimethylated DNA-binding domain-containing protein [Pleurotus pulmonarius]